MKEVQHFTHIGPVEALVRLAHARCHAVIKIRHRLTAVLVVLVGLDCNACQCRVAFNIIRFPKMTVTRTESAFQQFQQVDLTAGHGQGIEVHIVDMNVAFFMCLHVLRIDDIHLIEFLGTL